MSGPNHLEPILCVDPGRDVLAQLERACSSGDTTLSWERNLGRVIERFERTTFSVVVISSAALRDEVAAGIEVLEIISANSPTTRVIFLVSPRDIKLAAPALRAGTYQYAKIPISDDELKQLVDTAVEQRPAYGTNLLLKHGEEETSFEDMVGGSSSMRELYRLIRQAAATDIPVLLYGETGTGKDLAARAIHQLSDRSHRVYSLVHLGALPENLVASELFGHEKEAFTGAMEQRIGSFELSHGGTIFLDEISTIDEKIQVSLLRLLEDRHIHRIGGTTPVEVDVRVIAASNENLEQAVMEKRFREDLFFRLEVFQITIQPLRGRQGDVPLLVDYFLKRFNDRYHKTIVGIAPECVALLESYHWPGNVRELKNIIHRAVVLCSGDVILPDHLPRRFGRVGKDTPTITLPVGTTLAQMERAMITRTLAYTGGNRTRAAELLGISRRALYNKLARFGV